MPNYYYFSTEIKTLQIIFPSKNLHFLKIELKIFFDINKIFANINNLEK